MQSFHVARQHRATADGLHVAKQVHNHARLVPIGTAVDHTLLVGIDFQDRSESGIQFRVHENDVLAVGNGF